MARRETRQGARNVLMDLGLPDAEKLAAKAMLAKRINAILERRALTQSAAAELLGIPQPKISAIRNYKVRGISLERLMQALTVLGQNVEIVVTHRRKNPPRGLPSRPKRRRSRDKPGPDEYRMHTTRNR